MLFQSTAQHRAGRNGLRFDSCSGLTMVSIHRPAQSRAEPPRPCSGECPRWFQSTAQHRAGRNGVWARSSTPASSFQSTAQHRAGRNGGQLPEAPVGSVSIHRPAQSRAEQFIVRVRPRRLPGSNLREPGREVQETFHLGLFICHAARPVRTFQLTRTLWVFPVARGSR